MYLNTIVFEYDWIVFGNKTGIEKPHWVFIPMGLGLVFYIWILISAFGSFRLIKIETNTGVLLDCILRFHHPNPCDIFVHRILHCIGKFQLDLKVESLGK